MTTNRAYRPAMTFESSIEEIRRCTGTQFCPIAVKAFLSGLHLHTNRQAVPIVHPEEIKSTLL